MKLLKRILIGLIILIVLLLILAFILPKKMEVSVTKSVDAPPHLVYNIINDLRTQPQWNPWAKNDATMVMEYGDKTKGTGANYKWTSENSGSGSQEILESNADSGLKMNVKFDGQGEGMADYKLVGKGETTDVTWSFESETGVPFNLMNIFMKGSLKKSFTQGIDGINALAKKRYIGSEYDGYTIENTINDAKTYVINRALVGEKDVNQFYSLNLPELFTKVNDLDLKVDGKPSILYYSYLNADRKSDMAAALPLSQSIAISDKNTATTSIESGKALLVNYYGNTENVEKAHKAIQQYMADRKLLIRYPIIQEFVTDTSKESDPSKWHTRVIYPLAD